MDVIKKLNQLPRFRLSELVGEFEETWNYGTKELIEFIVVNKIDKRLDIQGIVEFCRDEENHWQPIPQNLKNS